MFYKIDHVAHRYFRSPFVKEYQTYIYLVISALYTTNSNKKVDLREVKAEIQVEDLKKISSILDASYNKLLKPVLFQDIATRLENKEDSNKEDSNKDSNKDPNNYRDIYIDNNSREEIYRFENIFKLEDKDIPNARE